MLLTMKDICKSFPLGDETIEILKHIDLSVEEGEYLAIMGPSGSGKTTFMNLLGCLDVPTSGSYVLDGQDVGGASDDALADIRNSTIGFVFQNYQLLPTLDAVDNVALPLLYANVERSERRERAKEALIRMGLEDRMDHRPNQLSGGQCQRVAIARAMINHPKLLLADEPTGALDSASGVQIMDVFEELNRGGTTVILITHDANVARRARITRHILDGRLLEEGEA